MDVTTRPQSTEVTRAEHTRSRPCFLPSVDIMETPSELLVLADMPGVSPASVDVNFENGVLTILGRASDRQPRPATPRMREYEIGDYYRRFTVSDYIDADKITAEFSNGVLTLRLPKLESARRRRIRVQAG